MNAEGLSSKKIQVKSWWKRFFLWIILLIIISLVFTFFLEWRFFDNSYIATLEFVKKYTKVFAWNAILMFFIILFFQYFKNFIPWPTCSTRRFYACRSNWHFN